MNLSVCPTMVGQDVAVVVVDGELDIGTAELLDAVLMSLLGRGVHHLVVAADRLRFCDVCGFRVLAGVHAGLTATGGSLAIAEPTPALRRLTHLMQQAPTIFSVTPIRMYATIGQALRGEIGRSLAPLTTTGSCS
jgi:anti-anti-sigma factor